MCKYLIMSVSINPENGNRSCVFSAPLWDSVSAAHDDAHVMNIRDYRVFPDTSDSSGIDALARMMVRTACKLLLEKHAGDNVNTINLLHGIRFGTYPRVIVNHDAADCVGAAIAEIWAAIVDGANIEEQAARALSAVYRHIRGERAYFNGRRERLLHLDCLTDADVAYYGAILDDVASDICADEEAHARTADAPRLMDCVNERLTDTQRAVMLLMSEGMTQAQIARVIGRSVGTVSHHVRLSRAVLAQFMRENRLPLPRLVTDADVAAIIANAEKRKAATDASADAARRVKRMCGYMNDVIGTALACADYADAIRDTIKAVRACVSSDTLRKLFDALMRALTVSCADVRVIGSCRDIMTVACADADGRTEEYRAVCRACGVCNK